MEFLLNWLKAIGCVLIVVAIFAVPFCFLALAQYWFGDVGIVIGGVLVFSFVIAVLATIFD